MTKSRPRSGQETGQSRVGLCGDTLSRPSRTVQNLGSASREIRTGSWRSASHKRSPVHKSNRAFVPLSTGKSPSRVPIAGLVLPTESPKAYRLDTRGEEGSVLGSNPGGVRINQDLQPQDPQRIVRAPQAPLNARSNRQGDDRTEQQAKDVSES